MRKHYKKQHLFLFRKEIYLLFFLFFLPLLIGAQSSTQLKAIEQQLSDYELVESAASIQQLLEKKRFKNKKYRQLLLLQTQLLGQQGKYQEAAVVGEMLLEKVKFPQRAAALNKQGNNLRELEQYDAAFAMFSEALAFYNKKTDQYPLQQAKTTANLGLLFIDQKKYHAADSIYTLTKTELEQQAQQEKPIYLKVLYRQAEAKLELGKFAEAQVLLATATELQAQIFPPTHPSRARILVHQGRVFYETTQLASAEQTFLKALAIQANSLGKSHPYYARTLRNLALTYLKQGEYAAAEEVLLEAKNIYNSNSVSNSAYGFTMSSLGELFNEVGKKEAAVQAYQEALNAFAALNNFTEYSISLNNLAAIYRGLNQIDKSVELFEAGRTLLKEKGFKQSKFYAPILINLGFIYSDLQELDKARAALLEAKQLVLNIFGERHNYYAAVISNLAKVYEKNEQYQQAKALYLETERIDGLVFGEKHPYFIPTLSNTANIYALLSEPDTAHHYYQRLIAGQTNLIYNYYSTFEEETRLSYLKKSTSRFDAFFSFVHRTPAITAVAATDLQNVSLTIKSLALDFSIDNKMQIDSLQDDTTIAIFQTWTDLRKQLSQAYIMSVKQRANANFDLAKMEEEVLLLEKKLIRSNTVMAQQLNRKKIVTHVDVQAKLNPREAALDFIKFNYRTATSKTDSVFYGVLITRNDQDTPQYLYLAEERKLARILRAKIRSNGGNYIANTKIGYDLYQLIWQPLMPYLQEIDRVKISPTGLLHKVAFAALPSQPAGQKLLMDQFYFDYYSNLRDLTEEEEQNLSNKKSATLVGGAVFDLDSLALQNLQTQLDQPVVHNEIEKPTINELQNSHRSMPIDTTRGTVRFNYLGGTRQEIEQIGAQLSAKNWQVNSLIGEAALEDRIKQVAEHTAPNLLHIATHGYFFAAPKKKTKTDNSTLRKRIQTATNPLIRSGLVFTGVNHTWEGGERIAGLDDGVLTAFEISNLDLFQTNLVVLSACETGLGDIYDTEGVFGLQRAFKMAGVQQLMTSLWKVPDRQTTELMQLFYKNYLLSKDAGQALHQAQLTMSQQYPAYYWAAFILIK